MMTKINSHVRVVNQWLLDFNIHEASLPANLEC